jgi:2-polyprenyl-3-methyl-5-hydroxy-6-metoxy-1,4-benzoquinol methylase
MTGHGWFEIPGLQTGERDLNERIAPLRPLLRWTKGATILDLGCAEGLIGKWLIDHGGAKLLHGIDKHPPYLDTARKLLPRSKYKAKFDVCDFDHWRDQRDALKLRPSYDIVLALNVIQKLQHPREFLLDVAALAKSIFVYSGPARILEDVRSGNVPVHIERELKAAGFRLIRYHPGHKDKARGHLGVRMIFQRRAKT